MGIQEMKSTTTNGGNGIAVKPTAESMSVETLMERITILEQRVTELEESPAQDTEDRISMVMFSGDLDKAIAGFIIATGAAVMGMEVSMFFTFWGLSILKKQKKFNDKNFLEKGFTAMLPAGTKSLGLSQNNYFGAGAKIIRKLMNDHEVSSMEELVEMAKEFGVRMVACDMTKELLGISNEELIDDVEHGGVATFMADTAKAKAALFI